METLNGWYLLLLLLEKTFDCEIWRLVMSMLVFWNFPTYLSLLSNPLTVWVDFVSFSFLFYGKGVLVSIGSYFGADRKVIELRIEETSLRNVLLMQWKSVRTLFGTENRWPRGKRPENPRQTRCKFEEKSEEHTADGRWRVRPKIRDQWKMLMILWKENMRKRNEGEVRGCHRISIRIIYHHEAVRFN